MSLSSVMSSTHLHSVPSSMNVVSSGTECAVSRRQVRPPLGKLGVIISFLVGLSVTFNLQIPPGSASAPRISDFMGVLGFGVLIVLLPRLTVNRIQFFFCVTGIFYFIAMTLFEAQQGGATQIIPLRWIFSFIVVLQLIALGLAYHGIVQKSVLNGMAWGAGFSLVISTMQILGIDIGLTASDANIITANLNARAVGLYEHPNANAHCMMLGAAAILQIAYLSQTRRTMLFVVFVVMVTGIYFTTGTRSVAMAATVMLLVFVARINSTYSRFLYLTLTSICCGLITVFYGDVIIDRMFGTGDADYFYQNTSVRIETLVFGMQVVPHNPFGLGVFDQRLLWQDELNTNAVHNGFLYGFVVFGWPFALIVVPYVMLSVRFLLGRLYVSQVPFGFVLTSCSVSLLFEDLPVNPSFSFVMVLGASEGLRLWNQSRRRIDTNGSLEAQHPATTETA